MLRPRTIIATRPDKTVMVCLWHRNGQGEVDAIRDEAEQWANENGYDVIAGICNRCIDRFHANSLRCTKWALGR